MIKDKPFAGDVIWNSVVSFLLGKYSISLFCVCGGHLMIAILIIDMIIPV